jgi:hypothetical protein
MYRQILLDPRDTHLQRILWRADRNECVKVYELKTVTYGTSSAPFLATRCLKQLAEDEGERFPRAAEVVTRDFYIDDLISGTENADDAFQLQELREMLTKGGFWLRKWTSNHPALLERIPVTERESKFPLEFNLDDTVRTLGLLWNPKSHKFTVFI